MRRCRRSSLFRATLLSIRFLSMPIVRPFDVAAEIVGSLVGHSSSGDLTGMKKGLWWRFCLGPGYGLDVYAAASAAVRVLSSAECSSVESCFEFLAVPLLPLVDSDTVFLLDTVAVPFWDDVEGAERDDSHVWC